MRADWQEVYKQFSQLEYRHLFGPIDEVTEHELRFSPPDVPRLIAKLRRDWRFKEGVLHGLHAELGGCRVDFRSHTGELGWGSMQICLSEETGMGMADVDHSGPYTDVVGFVGHAGEVIRGWWKRVWA